MSGGLLALTITEAQFERQVIAYAELRGWRVWKDRATNARRHCPSCGAVRSGPRNPAGLPDLLLVRRPRVVWAELKRERGKASPDQQAWLEELRACGQAAYLWRPSDWDAIQEELR